MSFQKKFKIAERALTAFIVLFFVMGLFLPAGITYAEYKPWVESPNTITGVSSADPDDVNNAADDETPNTVTKILAEGIGFIGTKINKGFKGNEGLDASITGIIMGKVVNGKSYFVFDLGDDCIWGKVGAVIYVGLRAVMLVMLFVAVLTQVIVPMWKGDSRGGALVKNALLTFTLGILIITVMPLIVDWMTVLRDRLGIEIYKAVDAFTTSSHSVSYTASDGTVVSTSVNKSLGNTIDSVYYEVYTDQPNIVNALLYLVVCCLPLAFIINYIKIAIIQTVLFGLFPMFAFVGTLDKGETIKKWTVTFATNCMIPCIDMALIFIPSLLIAAMMDEPNFDSSSLIVLIILVVCFFAIVPVRNQILGLFGNGGGWGLENGTTLGGILASAASVAAGAVAGAAGIFSDYKKNTDGASKEDLKEAEEAEKGLSSDGLSDNGLSGDLNSKANMGMEDFEKDKDKDKLGIGDNNGEGFGAGEGDRGSVGNESGDEARTETGNAMGTDKSEPKASSEISSDESEPSAFNRGDSSDDFAGSGENVMPSERGSSNDETVAGFTGPDSDTHGPTRNGDDLIYNADKGTQNINNEELGDTSTSGGDNTSVESGDKGADKNIDDYTAPEQPAPRTDEEGDIPSDDTVSADTYKDVSTDGTGTQGDSAGAGTGSEASSYDDTSSISDEDRAEIDNSTNELIESLSVSGKDLQNEAESGRNTENAELAREISQSSYVDSKKGIDHTNFNTNRAANLESMNRMNGEIKNIDQKNANLKADNANKTKEMRAAQKDLDNFYRANGIHRDENGHYNRKEIEEKMGSDAGFRQTAQEKIDRINNSRDAIEANKDAIASNSAMKEGLQNEVSRRQDVEKQYADRYAAAGHTGQTFSSAEELAGHLKKEERARNIVNFSNYKDKKFDGVLSESQKIQYQREAAKREAAGRLASGGAVALANVAAAPMMVASGNVNAARNISRAATASAKSIGLDPRSPGAVQLAGGAAQKAGGAVKKGMATAQKIDDSNYAYMQNMYKRSQGKVRNALGSTTPPATSGATSTVEAASNSSRAYDPGTDNYESRPSNRKDSSTRTEDYQTRQDEFNNPPKPDHNQNSGGGVKAPGKGF